MVTICSCHFPHLKERLPNLAFTQARSAYLGVSFQKDNCSRTHAARRRGAAGLRGGTKWQQVVGAAPQGAKGGVVDFRGRVTYRVWTQPGEAAGRPAPRWPFHLLWLHTEPPSSRLWELAFRAFSDPAGCAFVTSLSIPLLFFFLFV